MKGNTFKVLINLMVTKEKLNGNYGKIKILIGLTFIKASN